MQLKQPSSTARNEPSKIIMSCFRISSRVSRFLSIVAVAPEGLQPYWKRVFISYPDALKSRHTGTEYKTFGFGLSAGQFSRISRREDDCIPFPSVLTSDKAGKGYQTLQMEEHGRRTNQGAPVCFEHRNDTTESCFSSSLSAGEEGIPTRIPVIPPRSSLQDSISR